MGRSMSSCVPEGEIERWGESFRLSSEWGEREADLDGFEECCEEEDDSLRCLL